MIRNFRNDLQGKIDAVKAERPITWTEFKRLVEEVYEGDVAGTYDSLQRDLYELHDATFPLATDRDRKLLQALERTPPSTNIPRR